MKIGKMVLTIALIPMISLFAYYAHAANLFNNLFYSASEAVNRTDQVKIENFLSKSHTLNETVLRLGLHAYNKVRQQGIDSKQLLTIIDYSKPSSEPRLWVLSMKDNNVLFHVYVTHGKNSGTNIPSSFSDRSRSLKSSLGVFLTTSPYYGRHGYSLRVQGLEKGFNDHAISRAIVFHGARYASANFALTHGRLGNSWGCFAVSPEIAKALINTIKDGTVVFAYYPDQRWLSSSHFLS